MLEQAARSGVYPRLWHLTAGNSTSRQAPIVRSSRGVISVGASPAITLSLIASVVGRSDLLVFSYNDHTLDDAGYMSTLAALLDADFEQLAAESGVHIASRKSESTVYALRRTR